MVMMVETNRRPSLPERNGPAGPSLPLSVLLLSPSLSLFALFSRYFLLAQPEEGRGWTSRGTEGQWNRTSAFCCGEGALMADGCLCACVRGIQAFGGHASDRKGRRGTELKWI